MEHPHVAASLNNLAGLYRATGRYSEAEPLYKRALQIWEKALGREHPHVATSLNNLAWLYAATGKHTESHRFFYRGMRIKNKKREDVFLILSEGQKLNYMEQTSGSIHAFMTHTSRYMQLDENVVTDAFIIWLQWKGAVMEAQGRYIDAIFHSEDPRIKEKLDKLTSLRREIDRM